MRLDNHQREPNICTLKKFYGGYSITNLAWGLYQQIEPCGSVYTADYSNVPENRVTFFGIPGAHWWLPPALLLLACWLDDRRRASPPHTLEDFPQSSLSPTREDDVWTIPLQKQTQPLLSAMYKKDFAEWPEHLHILADFVTDLPYLGARFPQATIAADLRRYAKLMEDQPLLAGHSRSG